LVFDDPGKISAVGVNDSFVDGNVSDKTSHLHLLVNAILVKVSVTVGRDEVGWLVICVV